MQIPRLATNKKAFRDFEIIETFEAGIALVGSEVKSIRQSNANLSDSFARIEKGQLYLYNMHISPYEQASYLNVEAIRVRKLLMHRAEIRKLEEKATQHHYSIVPLKMYFNSRGFIKVELALAKGKKLYDKRQDIKKRETEMQIKRQIKNRRK